MSSSRMIATRQQQAFMSHICSRCGCPVVTMVQIDAESQKTYTFSQSKAEKIASDTAESAITHEIMRIEACRETKTMLLPKEKKGSMISPGYFCESSISGYDSCCPNCRHVEPWQSILSDVTMEELSEDNFPVVFKDPDVTNEWACDCIHDIINRMNEQRQSVLLVQQCTSNAIDTTKRIEELKNRLTSIPELRERELIKHRLQELQRQKNQLGLLDIKGKKENATQIKMSELKLKDIDKIIRSKEQPLEAEIQKAEDSLQHDQAIAFGCTDEISTKKLGNSLSYHYVPRNIPTEMLENYSKHSLHGSAEKETQASNITESSSGKQEDSEIRFCRKCGYELKPGSMFCSKCGSRIE